MTSLVAQSKTHESSPAKRAAEPMYAWDGKVLESKPPKYRLRELSHNGTLGTTSIVSHALFTRLRRAGSIRRENQKTAQDTKTC